MTRIAKSACELIGHTPLVDVSAFAQHHGAKARVLAKVESFNPMGSVKDRAALGMIVDAEARGLLQPGGHIVEATSGNTGIGLAWIATARGYRITIVMPDTMSVERRNLLKALGATVVLTPGAGGMSAAIAEAQRITAADPSARMLGQFENPANPQVHTDTTGPEIWEDTDGDVDCFVASVGTGGTITGTGRFLKAQNPALHVVAVEPAASPVLSGGQASPHKIQGIGAGFVPAIYDPAVVDEIVQVVDADAFAYARAFTRETGLLVGISSGAALQAACTVAARPDFEGKTLVVVLPDSGERYLSTPGFVE